MSICVSTAKQKDLRVIVLLYGAGHHSMWRLLGPQNSPTPADEWIPVVETMLVHVQTETGSEDATGQGKPGAGLVLFVHLVPKDRLELIKMFKSFYRRASVIRHQQRAILSTSACDKVRPGQWQKSVCVQIPGIDPGESRRSERGSKECGQYQRLWTFEVDSCHALHHYTIRTKVTPLFAIGT